MRPDLIYVSTVEEFRSYYWLKEELVLFCREKGIAASGNKADLAGRVEVFFETGELIKSAKSLSRKTVSRFDWNREVLSPDTLLTDNYRNTENVRAFFKKEIGARFRFTAPFMAWLKKNTGKPLSEAVAEWQKMDREKREGKAVPDIAPQFEYNRYIRDFLKNNPGKTLKEAIHFWNLKKNLPGDNHYIVSDLGLTQD